MLSNRLNMKCTGLLPALSSSNRSLPNQHRHYSSPVNISDNTCDIAIIGSGIMGLNVAYQIARRSSPNMRIKLFEKSPGPGYGSSGASSAICRTFYTFSQMAEFARDGMNLYRNWHQYLGCDDNDPNIVSKFTKTGLLAMIPMTESEGIKQKEKFDNLNIDYELIFDDNTFEKRFPLLNKDVTSIVDIDNDNDNMEEVDIDDDYDGMTTLDSLYQNTGTKHCYLYEKDAGYFDPTGALNDLQYAINKFYNNQIEVCFNNKVTNLNYQSGKITGITVENIGRSGDGLSKEIFAPIVINCNGPWYQELISKEKDLKGLDIELTLKAVRIQVIYKDLPQLFTNEILSQSEYGVPIPVVNDPAGGTYMRPQLHSKQILISAAREEDERDFILNPDKCTPDLGCDPDYRSKYLNSLFNRLSPILDPNMPGSSKVNGMTGMYTVCEEDVHPIIGQTKLKGFYVCNGFSGHGFKCAPAVGSILAKNITGINENGDTNVSIDFYSPYRTPHLMKTKNVLA